MRHFVPMIGKRPRVTAPPQLAVATTAWVLPGQVDHEPLMGFVRRAFLISACERGRVSYV